jgi:hypothetical protein
MAITTFDTYKFIRRLERVGMPVEQAEAQAEVLTAAVCPLPATVIHVVAKFDLVTAPYRGSGYPPSYLCRSVACAAASRATGTRGGEQLT